MAFGYEYETDTPTVSPILVAPSAAPTTANPTGVPTRHPSDANTTQTSEAAYAAPGFVSLVVPVAAALLSTEEGQQIVSDVANKTVDAVCAGVKRAGELGSNVAQVGSGIGNLASTPEGRGVLGAGAKIFANHVVSIATDKISALLANGPKEPLQRAEKSVNQNYLQ